jgi:hypothetical protein
MYGRGFQANADLLPVWEIGVFLESPPVAGENLSGSSGSHVVDKNATG